MALSDMSDNFPIHEGMLLASCYEVQDFLGEGSFGKVAKCADIVTDTKVAIKITKDNPFFTERALEELQTLDPDKCNLVRWNGSFFHERFICLEFELLDLSLHDYTRQRSYQSLSIAEIRPVIHQLTTALLHLEALGIMHADLKPENIMVVDRRQQPLQVKLIDFGLARHVSDAVPGSCVQSLWYRAPEVMLGLVFMEPIDMWSLGLVAAELALGFTLFPGYHEYDMMKFIVDTLGQPPDYLLNCGQKSSRFFRIQGSYNQQTWRLKSPEEFAGQTGHHFRDTRFFHLRSLEVLEDITRFRNRAEKNELRNFVDLLKKMLLVDNNGRIIPLKVLEHPFFSVEQHTDSRLNMNIKNLTVDRNEAEPTVTQQPSSQEKSVHGFELCNVASEATTPHEETVFTHPESVSAKLEDEEDKAAHIQPEVVVETCSKRAGCVKRFFMRIRKAFLLLVLQ
ncbi:homeodomain-interacting protein kinase 1-like isoform X2 [Siniperca chuatsi]|uniref:homeodomain-interacting protein kinase 1-like isoform X2 n=1 Tax=Siniperca chuatsi TaxID=119488 RepID=UPI001CE04D06|nr:homeodomain-interacting protein kinase 1-like isoform X2 [Siniperca chuatsi]